MKESACAPLLFQVLTGSHPITPFQTPFALDRDGDAVWLDLHHPETRHLLVEGGTSAGRAEVLRALIAGLATTTRPALMQILAVDTTGRELSIVDALPHAAAPSAGDAAAAQTSLAWLAADLEARRSEGRLWPEMLLVIEDLLALAPASGRTRLGLTTILRSGGAWGIHVIAAVASRTGGLKAAGWSGADVARLIAAPQAGWHEFVRGARRSLVHGARVTAVDLDLLARGRCRPSPSSAGRKDPFGDSRRPG
ncbi:MAG TPA: FtsK/SpoIIIE domain-containing protein [Anaerolineales bacterium]|nr:FtsK/SpoIIIE domain-containing protein [Anaerolineales bacterium]